MSNITNKDIKLFLSDFKKRSTLELYDSAEQKEELEKVAAARGIKLKDNRDLACFKTVFCFANEANKNNARLPKKQLLKALPSLIGKPVDIDHHRGSVVGHYLDYSYREKDDAVVAYGVFYKSNFGDLWDEAKALFKSGDLATSYEIWCPQDKRRELEDGTYELLEMEIAGGALLFKEEPAFENARVLELARTQNSNKDLVYASKYNEDDIISNQKDSIINSSEEGGNVMKVEETKDIVEVAEVTQEEVATEIIEEVVVEEASEEIVEETVTEDVESSSEEEAPNSEETVTEVVVEAEVTEEVVEETIEELTVDEAKTVTETKEVVVEDTVETEDGKVEYSYEVDGEVLTVYTMKDGETITDKTTYTRKNIYTAAEVEAKVAEAIQAKDEEIAIVKANAQKIVERRLELDEAFNQQLTDEDVIDDMKFEIAKLKIENAKLKAGMAPVTAAVESNDDVIGTKDTSDVDIYTASAEAVNKRVEELSKISK